MVGAFTASLPSTISGSSSQNIALSRIVFPVAIDTDSRIRRPRPWTSGTNKSRVRPDAARRRLAGRRRRP
jgi:hypothetical protein